MNLLRDNLLHPWSIIGPVYELNEKGYMIIIYFILIVFIKVYRALSIIINCHLRV